MKQKTSDDIRLYHTDHLGSTALVTDIDGEVTQNVAYIPYGEVFVEQRNGTWNTPYLFNAKELDEETGLYYYGARYLDPTGVRWLSVDPLFDESDGTSPYNYCHGNPIMIIDPDGRVDFYVDSEGNVTVTNPNSEKHTLSYKTGKGQTKSMTLSQSQYEVVNKLQGKHKDMFAYSLEDRYTASCDPDFDPKQIRKYFASYSIVNDKNITEKEISGLYKFLADASFDAEWSLRKYKNGDYVLSTAHKDNICPDFQNGKNKDKYNSLNLTLNIHSHPDVDGTKGASMGDMPGIRSFYEYWKKEHQNSNPSKEFPLFFVYHRQSSTLYQYTPNVSNRYMGTVSGSNLLNFCKNAKTRIK